MTFRSPEERPAEYHRSRLAVDLPVAGLVITALAHWIRGSPADALIFFAAAVLLLFTERHGAGGPGDAAMSGVAARLPGISLVLAVALVALVFGRETVPMLLTVSAIGLGALVLEWRQPSVPAPGPLPGRGWVWVAVAVGWCFWELVSFVYEQAAGLSLTHPTRSDLVDRCWTTAPCRRWPSASGWRAAWPCCAPPRRGDRREQQAGHRDRLRRDRVRRRGAVGASHLFPKKIPPLTTVLAALMRKRSTRIALVLAWWWVGWHFFVRS